jgi:hypothetical protein
MKLHNAVQNEAILSNVGEIGEFRIRNSAKAFNILSSGLYANKIRAIIRELSCNAVDSHVAAGKSDTPFDVHLPNALEPHFSIRDYGTGLNHEQVKNIYTTYFESTKTASNEFIGALGLGSKSPFSYTDNFTVTAIQGNKKGIYTAFINEQGVPSIALMMEEETSEPNGVEVRFAVNDRYDFDKFRSEARHVYEYFKLRPVVSGVSNFEFKDPEFKEKDIIPGVHHLGSGYKSYAIMGNIKYPVEVPNAETSLGGFHKLLNCGLVMEFGIGELDFQASREGLSYIPETINSIKNKLEALNDQLAIHIATEADKIENLWERAVYLSTRHSDDLWSNAVTKYAADTKFELFDVSTHRYNMLKMFELNVQELVSKYNIVIRGFTKSRGSATCSKLNHNVGYSKVGDQQVMKQEWQIRVSDCAYFVINDTKVGALERSKYHWRNSKLDTYTNNVYVIESADRNKPINTKAFFKSIYNPPADRIVNASNLLEKERAGGIGKNVTILHLTEGAKRGRWNSQTPMVWHDAGKADSFDSNETHYYLPLSGYQCLGVVSDVKELYYNLSRSGIFNKTIYGVRKNDMEWVKLQKNWVNLDTYIKDKLSKLGQADVMGLVKKAIGFSELYQYDAVKHVTDSNSPYVTLYNTFKDVKVEESNRKSHLEWLCRRYSVQTQANDDPSQLIEKYSKEVQDMFKRYPLLKHISRFSVQATDIAEYINLVDQNKGTN